VKRKCASGICHYCKKKVNPRNLTMGPYRPVIRGANPKGNLVPVCKECNDKKKYLLPIEWEEGASGTPGQRGSLICGLLYTPGRD